jgi:serine/threonine protein kinase
VRWTALEGIDERKFTQASDVWSFGIVMIEIYQDGMRPYPNIASNSQVFTFIRSGGRHVQPTACPGYAYELLIACWNEDASERPNFLALIDTISVMAKSAADAVEGEGGGIQAMFQTSPSLSHSGSSHPYQYTRSSVTSIDFSAGGRQDRATYEYNALVDGNASGSAGTGEEGGGAGGGGSSAGGDSSSGSAAAGGALLNRDQTRLMAMPAGDLNYIDAQVGMRSMPTAATTAEMNVITAPHHHQTLLEGRSLHTVTQL